MISKKENLEKFYAHECPDYIPDIRYDMSGINLAFEAFEAHPAGGVDGYDGYGTFWQFEPTNRASMPMPDPKTGKYVMTSDDIENWRDFVKWPDPETFDWEAHVEEDMANVDWENKYVTTSLSHAMWERLHALMGMEEACICIAAYPEETLDFFNAYADWKCAVIRKLGQYYPKLQMVQMSDDWGHSTGAFFSEEMWCKMFKPGMTKIINTCHECGFEFELHSCGKWEKLLPVVTEAGLDHWTSSQAINDIHGILVKYGRKLTMIGGCDPKEIQLPGMTYEKLKEITGRCIDDVCRGGCVIPFGNSSTPNFRQAVEANVAERADFYQKPENREVPKE